MFDSKVTVRTLIDEINSEADIAIDISDESYISWLNSIEQLLYSEVIQEQKAFEYTFPEITSIDLASIEKNDDEDTVRFEDLYAVYVDEKQLIKSTVASGNIFNETYYKKDNNLGFNVEHPKKMKIIRLVRPALKSVDTADTDTVKVPIEFIDMVKAKLRGESYKLANEDSLAAKWLNDYNVLLENFKVWISGKKPEFGL